MKSTLKGKTQSENPLPISATVLLGKRENNFNLLRFVLASLVILAHSPELVDGNRNREPLTRIFGTLSFGELAVDGFFLLSGYLIIQSWQRTPSLKSFLEKRILRIYPGFIAASLVSAFIVGPLGSISAQYFSQLNIKQLLLGMVRLQTPVVPSVFNGQPYPSVNGALWTIKFEFFCYLIVGGLGACGIFRKPSLWLMLASATLFLSVMPGIAMRLGIIGDVPGLGPIFDDPLVFARLVSLFCAGGCFYLYKDRITFKSTWAVAAAFVLVPCLFNASAAQIALATCGAYLLFWFAFTPVTALKKFNNFPDVSYGVYLYGWPLQKIILWYIPSLSPWLLFLLAWIGSVACGLLSWHLIEHPFLNLKLKLTKQPPMS